MLVLSRGPAEKIVFPNLGITLEVLRVKGNRVRVGIQAPPNVVALRHELAERRELWPPTDASSGGVSLSHQQRNRLQTAELALRLLQRQLESGLTSEALHTLQKALREFDALDAEFSPIHTELQREASVRRALLVEDNANESELLSGYLRMSGYEVDTADDGLKALVYLSRHRPPDVVLLDMNMPQLDGRETIQSIRNNPELLSVKIFAVTGMSREETGVAIGPGGVDRWFRKPVNPEELVAEMHRELNAVSVAV